MLELQHFMHQPVVDGEPERYDHGNGAEAEGATADLLNDAVEPMKIPCRQFFDGQGRDP